MAFPTVLTELCLSAGASEYEATDTFKRAPCLACGKAVFEREHRFFNVTGTLDGTWIVFTADSTHFFGDTDRLPHAPTFLLGVVHTTAASRDGCWPEAIRRLRSRQIVFADDLPPVEIIERPRFN
jgi:hypothetical protein